MDESPEPVRAMPNESGGFQFRLMHVIYIMTLWASALATFGASGLLPAGFISIFWALVFTNRSRPRAFCYACAVTLIFSCPTGLLLPAVNSGPKAASRMWCSNNLKQLGLALHNYHDVYGSFPPAYIADENGKPMHSWRVLILPFLEQQPLYDRYDFREPWNGPSNRKLLDEMPQVYSCPTAVHSSTGRTVYTSYVAVVGSTTAWPGQTPPKFADIRDGLAKTGLVVEYSSGSISWLEPRDLEFSEATALLASADVELARPHRTETFFYEYFTGRNVALADGSVWFVVHGTDRTVWSALLGADDGIAWEEGDLYGGNTKITKRLRWGNCLRLALFILLTLFPLPWVWLNPNSTIGASSARLAPNAGPNA